MKLTKLFLTALIGSTVAAPAVFAEDIDIFKPVEQDGSPPNVLIFLDNTANWSSAAQAWNKQAVWDKCAGDSTCQNYVTQIFGSNTSLKQGEVEVAALRLVLNELVCKADEPIKLNLGMMVIGGGAYSGTSDVSGLILRAVSPLVKDGSRCTATMDYGGIVGEDGLLDRIFKDITNPLWKAPSSGAYGGPMFEAFKYFGGYSKPTLATSNTAAGPTGHVNYGPMRYEDPNPADVQITVNGKNQKVAVLDLQEASIFQDGTKPIASGGKSTYLSPLDANASSCSTKNYLLMVGNGYPSGGDISTLLTDNLGYSYTAKDFAFATLSKAALGDVWAKFLSTTDVSAKAGQQTVSTYAINVFNDKQDLDYQTPYLKSIARNGGPGGRGYYEVGGNLKALIDAFKDFFTSINAVNSVFASSALPVSTNVRGTHLNQVYMGMFRPDENKLPRWFGNLKLYQLAIDPLDPTHKNVIMVDSSNPPKQVANNQKGFIEDKVVSFWTKDTTPPFWTYRCSAGNNNPVECGNPPSDSDSPDGAVVEKGGAAQQLRLAFTNPKDASNSSRTIYTCSAVECLSGLASFDTNTLPPTDLNNQKTFLNIPNPATVTSYSYGNTTVAANLNSMKGEVTDIINWVRGVDNTNPPEGGLANAGGVRPSIIGDVLHLRPVVVNYNKTATGCLDKNQDKDVVVYYGGNDGMLHALQGGTDASIPNVGKELWSFVPPEFFNVFRRLREGNPEYRLPSPVSATLPDYVTSNNKPYFIDGALSAYTKDTNKDCRLTSGSGDKAYLFMTMRRGGRFIYALDVTDPKHPQFKWMKSNTDSGYSELGQTWSQLTPIALPPDGSHPNGRPAVIFGAGYDPGADDIFYDRKKGYLLPPAFSANPVIGRSMGRGIFVADAETGEVIRQFGWNNGGDNTGQGMNYSIPSDLTVLSEDDTGFAKLAYVGDTGGNLWRVDLRDPSTHVPTSEANKWSVTKLASLGTYDPAQPLMPLVSGVPQENARKFLFSPDAVRLDDGGYSILIGSGDREKPFDTGVKNRFYMIKDDPNGQYPINCQTMASCALFNATNSKDLPADAKGWYIDLLGKGEKTVGSAVTLSGTTLFPTNQPPSKQEGSCDPSLGTARMYGISYLNGAASMPPQDFTDQGGRATEVPGGGFPPSPVPIVVDIGGEYYKLACSGPKCLPSGKADPGRRAFSYFYKEQLD